MNFELSTGLKIVIIIICFIIFSMTVEITPTHDFEINETREFKFLHEGDLTYTGTLTWDGEHFTIDAHFQGWQDGGFVSGAIWGIDDDATLLICSQGSSYRDEHKDFSRTVLLNEMIKNRVNKTRINDSR